ncbi:MAG: carboxymuconolactone decarboxylase family protein [Bacteroidetes bacterium]|nr:carboxymuconolactone decarboxylase family protein [Bacteroidota bacterium]MCW5894946.1 carboxymuconolactone decarboxylase family protein [Bacteroidota bacterium]
MSKQAIPKRFLDFTAKYPEVAEAYERLGKKVHSAGPLTDKERALVKFAISIGARLEGGAHSHARKALAAGVKKEELYHVALLAMQTIGFPSSMAAMSWTDDVVKGKKKKR